jgi:Ulp1 family protease
LVEFDQVFIPINSANHWFSALIDYRRKKIEIYDSLSTVHNRNITKPIQDQQNAALMQASNVSVFALRVLIYMPIHRL